MTGSPVVISRAGAVVTLTVALLLALLAPATAAVARGQTLHLAPAALAQGSPTSAQLAATPPPGNLGTNLGAVTYYDGLVPFANLMDQAGDWVPQRTGGAWGAGAPLALRHDGWPSALSTGQYATAVLAEVSYPDGTYAVSWTGSGTFDINGTGFSGRNGSGSVVLDGTSLALLNLRTTDPADPVRAVRVMVPGAAAGAVFRAGYLAQLAPYSALRFMDWQRTNSVSWEPRRVFSCDTRTLPTSYSQGTGAGASVERMVELANALDADPWFNLPHEAPDSWTTCVARVVATSLEPGLTPRFEFSNETWNPTFRAFGDLTAEGRSAGLGAGDAFLGLQLRHGQRHVAAMAAVASGFSGTGRTFVRVMAGQAANSWVLEQRLGGTGAAAATDEIAIAPYLGVPGANPFDAAEAAGIATWSRAQLFASLARAQTAEVDAWTADHVRLAASSGKRLVAYEGGQHLAGDTSNDALTALFTGANRAAEMGGAYRTYLDRWRTATGNALFMHFTDMGPATRWGSWGALEPGQTTSPKYAELVRFAGPAAPPPPPAVVVPTAPGGLRAVPGDASATITFTAPASNGGAAITNYEVALSTDAGRTWKPWKALSPPDAASPVLVTALANGTAYQLKLRALNTAGPGAASAAVAVTPRSTASAPTALRAVGEDKSAVVYFTAPASNGGAAITNYMYRTSLDGRIWSSWRALSPADAASPVVVPGLVNGRLHTLQLLAVNAAGAGASSAAVTVTPRR